MKQTKKAAALIVSAAMAFTMAVPALAGEAAPVITGIVMSEDSVNYVDSAQYSQYDTVEFSDGTSQSIDASAQTFVLVKDGAIVDLDDPDNWTEDAQLYVVDKGQFDEVMMSMNTANWGPFYQKACHHQSREPRDGRCAQDLRLPFRSHLCPQRQCAEGGQ